MINKFILISTYIYVAMTTLPFVNAIIPAVISLGVFSASLLFCFINQNVLKKSAFILFFLICDIFCYTNFDKALILRLYQGIILVYPCIIIIYFIETNQIEKLKNILFFYLISVGITSITTYRYLLVNPGTSRMLATGKLNENENVNILINNCGGYGFINSLIILFPLIIGLYKTKKINKILFSIISYFMFLVILKSEYTTAILFFIFELAFLIYNPIKMKFYKYIFYLIISCILLFFVFKPILLYIIDYIVNICDSVSINERLNNISQYLNYSIVEDDSAMDNRINRYQVSIYYIKNYFLVGNMIYGINAAGGHSTFLDMIALTGILGIINYAGMYLTVYHYMYKNLKRINGKEYYIFSCLIFVIFSTINNVLFSSMFLIIFLIGPLMIFYYNTQNKSDE